MVRFPGVCRHVSGASYGSCMELTRPGGRPDEDLGLVPVTARDVPGCAWTLALAETSNRRPMWLRKATAAVTLGVYLVMVAVEPDTYHRNRVLVVNLSRQHDPVTAGAAIRRAVGLVGAALVPVLLVFALSGWANSVLWLAAAAVAGLIVIPAAALLIGRKLLRRGLSAQYRSEPEKAPSADWKLSMLAKRPGADVEHATSSALAHAKLLGEPSETIGLLARNAALVRWYERHGFRSVPGGLRQMRGTLADLG